MGIGFKKENSGPKKTPCKTQDLRAASREGEDIHWWGPPERDAEDWQDS